MLPEVETHTVANNGNEIDLKELTEGNEREKAAFHSPFAETPKDKGQEIQAFHALYQKLTGYSEIALDMARERQWFEWLQYGITHQHPFTHEDFKLVIKLIHEGIANATSNQGAYRRNQGASNLIISSATPADLSGLGRGPYHTSAKGRNLRLPPNRQCQNRLIHMPRPSADKVSQEIARRDGEISTAIEKIKDDDANWNFSQGVRRCLTRQADLDVSTLQAKRAALKR